jgi:hypothetical protein
MRPFGAYVVECLAANGVEFVFGIPGVHTVELYRALPESPIRHVTPRHEQGAGFMAEGYARVTGKPGVCFVITGPGLTNIATAMAQAYGESMPMLVISTVNPVGAMGSGAGHLHELPDQRQLMRQFTAFSHTILDIAEFDTVLARAFAVFSAARPRPVHIEIPVDLLSRDSAGLGKARPVPMIAGPGPNPIVIEQAVLACNRAASPLIVAGGRSPLRPFLSVVLVKERDAIELAVSMLEVQSWKEDRRTYRAQAHLAEEPPMLPRKRWINDGDVVRIPIDLIGRDCFIENRFGMFRASANSTIALLNQAIPNAVGTETLRCWLLRRIGVPCRHCCLSKLTKAYRRGFGKVRASSRQGEVRPDFSNSAIPVASDSFLI